MINVSKYLTIVFSIFIFFIEIGLLFQKKYLSMLALITIYFCYLLFLHFEKKGYFKANNISKALIMTNIILHSLLGELFSLYLTTKWFDKTLHVFGTFSFSLFFYLLIESTGSFVSKSKIFDFVFIVSIGMATGVVFEITEFICDIIFNIENQHGQLDTNLDIMCDTLGAVLAGFFVFKYYQKSIIK